MLRIQSLAEKGAISASQRGYLDNLVASPDAAAAATENDVHGDDFSFGRSSTQEQEGIEESEGVASSTSSSSDRRPKHAHRKNINVANTLHTQTVENSTIANSTYTPAPPAV